MVFVALFLVVCVIAGVVFDHLSKRVQRLSECVAPLLVMITFVQTLDLVVGGIPLEWPHAVSAVATGFSIFNFNVELSKPECSVDFDFASKQIIILLLPVFVQLEKQLHVRVDPAVEHVDGPLAHAHATGERHVSSLGAEG